jgi:hypothetical protein
MDYSIIGCEVSDIRYEKDTIDTLNLELNLVKVNWHYRLPDKIKTDYGASFSICDSTGQESEKILFKSWNGLESGTPQALKIYCRYYNEKGLIDRYTYSSCMICSDMAFDVQFFYDSKDRII